MSGITGEKIPSLVSLASDSVKLPFDARTFSDISWLGISVCEGLSVYYEAGDFGSSDSCDSRQRQRVVLVSESGLRFSTDHRRCGCPSPSPRPAAAHGVPGTPGNPWTNGYDSDSEVVDDENDDDDLFFLNLRSAGTQQGQASGQSGSCSVAAAAVQSSPDLNDLEKGGSATEDSAALTLPQPLANPGKGKPQECGAEDEFGLTGGHEEAAQSQTQMQTQTQTQEMVFSEAVQHSQEAERGSSSLAGPHGLHVPVRHVQVLATSLPPPAGYPLPPAAVCAAEQPSSSSSAVTTAALVASAKPKSMSAFPRNPLPKSGAEWQLAWTTKAVGEDTDED